MRTFGRPSASAVASAIASGSFGSAFFASSNQLSNKAKGSVASVKSLPINAFNDIPLEYSGHVAGEDVRLDCPFGLTQIFYSSCQHAAGPFRPGFGAVFASALLALAVSGCSVSMPMTSLVAHKTDEDVTGSISRPPFAEWLGVEDWRRARAAMATALDPQGAGSTVAWDNPDSGLKGKFIPSGKAYPENDLVCRAFVAEIDLKNGEKTLQGKACADKDGDWTVADLQPLKKT